MPIRERERLRQIAEALTARRWSARLIDAIAPWIRVESARGGEYFLIAFDEAYATRRLLVTLVDDDGVRLDSEAVRVRADCYDDVSWLANASGLTLHEISQRQYAPAPTRRGRR